MTNVWKLWQDDNRSPQLNMAIDDMLLHRCKTVPETILRFYGWDRPTHTIGYFQPIASAPSGDTVIRRPSGGGVVDHRNDFTFTLVFPEISDLFQCDRFESYRQLNAAVQNALRGLGTDCFLFGGDVPKEFDRSYLVCFEQPAKFDVVNQHGKLCGGAQRRKRHGMLHQGSILMDHLQGVTKAEVGQALIDAFTQSFQVVMEPFEPGEDLLARADNLAQSRYGSDHWNLKK